MKVNRKLKMGMIGGGIGAFIGDVHRKASRLDGEIELVAGAFDINPKNSKKIGKQLYLDSKRVYGDYKEMIKAELALPEGERIDFAWRQFTSPAVVPLYEYRRRDGGARLYSTDPNLEDRASQRSAGPVCRVWRNPMSLLILDHQAKPVALTPE